MPFRAGPAVLNTISVRGADTLKDGIARNLMLRVVCPSTANIEKDTLNVFNSRGRKVKRKP